MALREVLVSSACGFAAAVVAVLALGHSRAAARTSFARASSGAVDVAAESPAPADETLGQKLEEGRGDDAIASDSEAAQALARNQFAEEQSMLLGRLRNGRRDPAWAGQATRSLARSLEAWSDSLGFDVVSVECNAQVCRAELRWDDYPGARMAAPEVVQRTVPELPCAQRIQVPPPSDPALPYLAEVYWDCASP